MANKVSRSGSGKSAEAKGNGLNQLIFRLKLTLLYPVGVLLGVYYKSVKNVFPRHGAWLRLNVPRLIGQSLLALHRMKLDVSGGRYLDCAKAGKTVVFANHNSRLDPYVLFAVLPVPYKSFWSTRAHVISERMNVVKWFGKTLDLFFLHDKHDARRTAREFRKATGYVKAGNVISFFPEGRFSDSGKPSDFGVACARLAIDAQAQILPILIHGTRQYHEEAGEGRRDVVRITVCPPISTHEYSKKDAARVSQLLEAKMRQTYETIGCDGTQAAKITG